MRRKSISQSMKWRVLAKDFFCCRYCGRQAGDVVLHVDHIVAVKNGGKNDEDNLCAACDACNSSKGAKKLEPVPADRRQKSIEALGKLLSARDEYPETYGRMLDHSMAQIARLAEKKVEPTAAATSLGMAALGVAILSLGMGLDGKLNKRWFLKLCSTMYDEETDGR